MGVNRTSPRTEVIHRVTNKYFNKTLGDTDQQAATFGEWKLIVGSANCNDSNTVSESGGDDY